MKSQDIVLLLKLVSLHRVLSAARPPIETDSPTGFAEQFTTRGLEAVLGLSKSEVSKALQRCIQVGLVTKDRKTGYPRSNTTALFDFIVYGLKYVFPAQPGPLVRGIPTAAGAPVLQDKLAGTDSHIQVWPDPLGKVRGQRIEPLYKSVPFAVKQDADLYAMLALVDAIRLGKPRESELAGQLLGDLLKRQ